MQRIGAEAGDEGPIRENSDPEQGCLALSFPVLGPMQEGNAETDSDDDQNRCDRQTQWVDGDVTDRESAFVESLEHNSHEEGRAGEQDDRIACGLMLSSH